MAAQQFPVTNNVSQPQILIANGNSLPGHSFAFLPPGIAPGGMGQPGQPQTILCAAPQQQQLATYVIQSNQSQPRPTLIQLADGRFALAQTPQRPVFQPAPQLGQMVARPQQFIVQQGGHQLISNYAPVSLQSGPVPMSTPTQPIMASAISSSTAVTSIKPTTSMVSTPVPNPSVLPNNSLPLVNGQTSVNKSSDDLLKRLSIQIDSLISSKTPLSVAQQSRLKQLQNLQADLLKKGRETEEAAKQGVKKITPPVLQPVMLQPQVRLMDATRKEILSTFQRLDLMPKCALNAQLADTFIVEFRLGKQAYKLRLSRAQKTAIEGYLQGKTSQNQSEILSVFISEQSALQTLPIETCGTQLISLPLQQGLQCEF
ncbi:hypothetical protein Ciccas_005487 [Cichlidogyrus casuarinus]|uniref:Uncharacterized protein n=1 Tax=Cichlidogyrus casuarinus TaxID=1844966 RepID=A0ABD2Q8K5_9PLAT